jgi:hypothetical protein
MYVNGLGVSARVPRPSLNFSAPRCGNHRNGNRGSMEISYTVTSEGTR